MPDAMKPLFDSDGDNSAQACKAGPGYIRGIEVSNRNTTEAYLQLFDALAADVSVGTTVPTLSFKIPAGDGTDNGAMDKDFGPYGIQFDTGITYACTTTATGAVDPTLGLYVNLLYW
jgi:hypothetical protein